MYASISFIGWATVSNRVKGYGKVEACTRKRLTAQIHNSRLWHPNLASLRTSVVYHDREFSVVFKAPFEQKVGSQFLVFATGKVRLYSLLLTETECL